MGEVLVTGGASLIGSYLAKAFIICEMLRYYTASQQTLGNVKQWLGGLNPAFVWEISRSWKLNRIPEEYGLAVTYVNETYTSSKCSIHGEGCGKRMKRGLFRCTKLNKVFNADLVGAYDILITPSPDRDRGNGPETRSSTKPSERGNVALNLPTLAGTFSLEGREEVRKPANNL
jgi:putative transposase